MAVETLTEKAVLEDAVAWSEKISLNLKDSYRVALSEPPPLPCLLYAHIVGEPEQAVRFSISESRSRFRLLHTMTTRALSIANEL